MKTERATPPRLLRVAWATVAAVFLLVLLEWLFQVTRPSMFTVSSWPQRVSILLAAAFVLSVPAVGAAMLLGSAWSRLGGRWRALAGGIGLIVPALVLSAASFLAIENFTKTVFGFNSGSFTSPIRYLYAIGWLVLTWRIHGSLARWIGAATERRRGDRKVAVAVAVALAATAAAAWLRYEPQTAAAGIGAGGGGELPNVLFFSSDGINATNMSVYGYERATTPFLESRAEEFLISENHFTNSTMTTASIGALLSGKLPTRTGVLRGGNVFQGEHVFQHLPGLLRQLGYYNIDISARRFGDAYDMNIRQGFHVANGRSFGYETLPGLRWIAAVWPSESYFLGLTMARLGERLLHVIGIADMVDPFDLVAKKQTSAMRDGERLEMLEAELARAARPFFAQVHLYDTHRVPQERTGPESPRNKFIVTKPVFSAREEPDKVDYYDDTLLGYDGFVERVVALLQSSGELDKTVLVINSDHGERRLPQVRLPLMIRFPNAEHRGRIVANTQRIDIAPTILSYLGMDPPGWMQGQSLLGAEPDPMRRIVVTGEGKTPRDRWLSVVHCQRAYLFHVKSTLMEEFGAKGHTASCPERDLIGQAAARRQLLAHVDVSGLLAIPFETQIASLQQENSLEMRRQAARSIRLGQVPALWLGKTIAISNAHQSFWTNGTRPAAILLRNDAMEPRAFELRVGSGDDREFPVGFFVQDDERTREHLLSSPGTVTVDLGEIAPESEGLFLVWSQGTKKGIVGGRRLGVKLLLNGTWLRELLRSDDTSEWQAAASTILDYRVPSLELADGLLAVGVHPDLWTRGSEPAGIAVRNEGSEPLVRSLVVQSGKGHEFPLRLYLHDGHRSREFLYQRPGRMVVDLPAVPAGSERFFILRSERGRTSESRSRRELGVRLSLPPAA